MKENNFKFSFWVLIIVTGFIMLLADFLLQLFFDNTLAHIGLRLGVPGLVFIAVYCVILGMSAKRFDKSFFDKAQGEAFTQRLKAFGSVPIKMIGISVLLHSVFLSCVFFDYNYLGLERTMQAPLFLASLAFGMLVGTFIYVISDGLVSHTLISHNFTQYPPNLRERRQELKSMIIPSAATLMALIFACSVTLLGIRQAGGSLDNLHGKAWAGMLIPIIIVFFCILSLSLNLKKNTSRLYTSIIEQLENLSSEQKDLTRRITVCSVDELGTVAGMVNTFSEYLSKGIFDIKTGQKDLSGIGNQLEENASSMAASIGQIAVAAEQVLGKTKGQMESVNTSTQAVRKISENIKSQEESTNVQTNSVSQASSAVEQMLGNISSIGSVTEKMAAQFKTVGEASDKGNSIQKESAERISKIVAQSQTLQETNKIIATIAAQTNLLAMNAAIEAAHAGESGRGFSVVADEIRQLAIKSSNESKKISVELKQIVQSINQIVKDVEASTNAFFEVSRRIDDTEKLVLEVNNAINEQKTGADQVTKALRMMNELAAKVSSGSRDMSNGSEVMLKEINALRKSAEEIMINMEEVSSGIKSINTGAQGVSDLAITSRSSIQKISVITEGFKVESKGAKKKILVIDDDENHLVMTKNFLNEAYDITTVKSCEAALEKIFEGNIPNFILLDLMMPDVDGWETFARLKKNIDFLKVKVAIFTASDDPKDRDHAQRMGAIDYIRKPCKKSELLERIQKVLKENR